MNTARIVVLANGFGDGVTAPCRANGRRNKAIPFGPAATTTRSPTLRSSHPDRIELVRSGISASATMQA